MWVTLGLCRNLHLETLLSLHIFQCYYWSILLESLMRMQCSAVNCSKKLCCVRTPWWGHGMYHIHLPLHYHLYGHICLTLVIFLFVFGTLKKPLVVVGQGLGLELHHDDIPSRTKTSTINQSFAECNASLYNSWCTVTHQCWGEFPLQAPLQLSPAAGDRGVFRNPNAPLRPERSI